MSFSSDVKNEIMKHPAGARHCQLAQMAAFVNNLGMVRDSQLIFEGEENTIAYIEALLKKLYAIDKQGYAKEDGGFTRARLTISSRVDEISKSVKYSDDGNVSELLIKNSCCRKSYLQGMFLASGSVTDPEKGYHLEFVSSNQQVLKRVQEILLEFDIVSKITARKNNYMLYIKEGQHIVDLLNVMGAHKKLMDMENSIIMHDFRNNLNRKVNCETANLMKTANAGSRQKADIEFLRDNYGLDNLPDNLKEIAVLRLEYPDISLKELGEMMDPPLGKSGVNHRLRKLSELRDSL